VKMEKLKYCKIVILLSISTFILCVSGCVNIGTNKVELPSSSTISESTDSHLTRTSFNTPQNIDLLRQQLLAYYNSGGYEAALQQVGDEAMQYLKSCKNTPGKLAIVFDIDETTLSNWEYEKNTNFGFTHETWVKYKEKEVCTPIKPSLELYKEALKQNVTIFFITASKESYRQYYEPNLRKAGYTKWEAIIFEPTGSHFSLAEEFKSSMRKKITEEGYRIILNIGDQYSDLAGGYADRCFKLPNPFYFIP